MDATELIEKTYDSMNQMEEAFAWIHELPKTSEITGDRVHRLRYSYAVRELIEVILHFGSAMAYLRVNEEKDALVNAFLDIRERRLK